MRSGVQNNKSIMRIDSRSAQAGCRLLLLIFVLLWGPVAIGQHSIAKPDYVVSVPHRPAV